MLISFGKKKGQLVEKLLIDDPDYVLWMLDESAPSGPMASVVRHVSVCLKNFNARKFVKQCAGKTCENTATRLSLYPRSASPYYWCDSCDPYQAGATKGLTIVKSYEEALLHARSHGTKDSCSALADSLATAKGSKKPRRAASLVEFFSTSA